MIKKYGGRKKIRIPESREEAYQAALKTGYNILSYKDNTEYTFREKLSERGFLPETVDDVTEYMKRRGFINDGRMLYSAVRRLALTKLYGKARIKQELALLHFDRALLSSLNWDDEEISDVDFGETCYKLLKKRHGARDRKTYDFLRRYGHSPSDIKSAYLRIESEDDIDGVGDDDESF